MQRAALALTLGVLIGAAPWPTVASDRIWPVSDPAKTFGCDPGIGYKKLILNDPESIRAAFEIWARNALDPECLSNPKARVVINVSTKAVPATRLCSSSNADAADIFYCEQAIWESLPAREYYKGVEGDITFAPGDEGTSRHGQSPDLVTKNRRFVKLHLVPGSVFSETNVALSGRDIQAPANVVRLKTKNTRGPELQRFRQEWFSYILDHRHLSRKEIAAQAQAMRDKYHRLFVKE